MNHHSEGAHGASAESGNQNGDTDMNAKLLIAVIAAALFPLAAHAHDCSGGADGGMDATGNQCNAESVATAGLSDRATRPSTRLTRSKRTKQHRAASVRPRAELQREMHRRGRGASRADRSIRDQEICRLRWDWEVTTHYSAAELSNLIAAANRVCESEQRRPELVVLRARAAA
jgi:hypothetical protein